MTVDRVPRAGRREWIGLAVIALPCLLYSMSLRVLYLGVPRMSADLEPASAQLLWITDVYSFVLARLLLKMGTLGDRIVRDVVCDTLPSPKGRRGTICGR